MISASKPSCYNLRKETKDFAMPPLTPVFATDRQRLARAGQRPKLLLAAPTSDKARLARVASARPIPKPLVVSRNTFVIRGKDDTFLGFAFGDARQVHQISLYDYLPADRVPHLGNYVLDLTGILPDAIGIDIGASAGASVFSLVGGINILWHTRGEGNRSWYPEIHEYYGYSGSFNMESVYKSITDFAPNASAAVQILLAWARTYDDKGRSEPASNKWVANGFNWTGTFWSAGFSIPLPPRFTLVGSYYQSVPFYSSPKTTSVWRGVSFGIGVAGKTHIKSPFIKLDLTKILDLKHLSVNQSKTEYGLVFGNGNDFIPQRANRDITGWHMPVNQNDYPE